MNTSENIPWIPITSYNNKSTLCEWFVFNYLTRNFVFLPFMRLNKMEKRGD